MDKQKKKQLRQKGQLTIFFSVSMLSILTMLAFLVNVGLFVKAKINLQNAVDAAAWSGAATQARQLSEIAYLNWEMRNVYKEWMFKYYVLGSLSINEVKNLDQGNGGYNQFGESVSGLAEPNDGKIQFYMMGGKKTNLDRCFTPPNPDGTGREGCPDRFNFPSVCIHIVDAGTPSADVPDICKMYNIPGLPEIGVSNLPGVDQSTQNFIDRLVEKKAENCTERSDLNFLVATNWAYGIKKDGDPASSTFAGAPQIAIDRTGAFPQALELAIRIRTLEHIMNTPAVEGICKIDSEVAGNCVRDLTDLTADSTPHYERSVKAFYSAYRNLGNDFDNEMKESFVLTELSPTEFIADGGFDSLSYTFMPKESAKYYVDLRPLLVNLVTFYTSFIPKGGVAGTTADGGKVTSSGDCSVTKVALPIPGYPIGFAKNPAVLTYYAVKGEANFFGLLNPFQTNSPAGPGFVKLTTYAAAKPFGARIGPHLFEVFGDNQNKSQGSIIVTSRTSEPFRSNAYISGLQYSPGTYNFGDPIPLSNSFWVQSPSDYLGGWVDGSEVRFSIPNLLYEYLPGKMRNHRNSTGSIQIIDPNDTSAASEPKQGLYDRDQFEAFRANFAEVETGGAINADSINRAINMSRAPTNYDKMNYLVPTLQSFNSGATGIGLDTIGYVHGTNQITSDSEHDVFGYEIYAPLYDDRAPFLFHTLDDVRGMVNDYMQKRVIGAVEKYLHSLYDVRQRIILLTNDARYAVAASGISNSNGAAGGSGLSGTLGFTDCQSIASKMAAYLLGPASGLGGATCPTPFLDNLYDYWDSRKSDRTLDAHQGEYVVKRAAGGVDQEDLLSAYRPGEFQGGNAGGRVINNILGTASDMRRNYYSTKFISVRSVTIGSPGGGMLYDAASSGAEVYSERGYIIDSARSLSSPVVNGLSGLDLTNVYR